MQFTRIMLSAVAWCMLLATAVVACNVPVFRYALDHWQPDRYRIVVIHDAPLDSAAQKRIEELDQRIAATSTNAQVQVVKLSARNAGNAEDRDRAASGLPKLQVFYPAMLDIPQPTVELPFDDTNFNQLFDSPVRKQLIERLVDGQSAVWILVESSQPTANAEALGTLDSTLKSLEQSLELPKLTDDPEDAISDGPKLRVQFSTLVLSHTARDEKVFRDTLLGIESDLKEIDEPLVFAVFGRGRGMLPLVGAGITPTNIRETASFLCGACSCQVKEQNPGFDLLMAADWDKLMPWTKSTSNNPEMQVAAATIVPIPKGSESGAKETEPEAQASADDLDKASFDWTRVPFRYWDLCWWLACCC